MIIAGTSLGVLKQGGIKCQGFVPPQEFNSQVNNPKRNKLIAEVVASLTEETNCLANKLIL